MAKFCKYCGKQLTNGFCDCAQAAAEAEERARAQVIAAMEANSEAKPQSTSEPVLQQAGQAFQKTAQSIQQSQQAKQATQRLGQMKDLLVEFVKHPSAAMQYAAQETDKMPQYLITALFAVFALICGCIMLRSDAFKGSRFGMSLMMAVAVIVIRLVYAGGTYVMVKRQNAAIKLNAVIALFSMTLFVDTIMILLILITSVISLYELAFAFVLFWMVSTVVLAFLAVWVLNGRNMENAVRVSLLLQLILTIILVFTARGLVISGFESMTRSMMRGFGM